ncbi:MAG: ATP-binding protein, partial [Galactobacillus timonensis]|nr:ATP-binding protein [Galactobacillus timonensis]
MLLRFSVENYQSFRDQVTLDLTPGSGKDNADHIIQDAGGNNSALNSILIYGANASGKSALFKAMTLALNILR